MESLYNVYFAGEVLDGHSRDSVREKLGKLFNADEATLNKLFSGKPQLLKRECDKGTALKYQQAIERAGAKALIKAITAAASAISPPAAPTTTGINQTMSAAQRIAALAQAPDRVDYSSQDTSETTSTDEFIAGWYVGTVEYQCAGKPNAG